VVSVLRAPIERCEGGAAVLHVRIGMVAVTPGDLEESILRRHGARQPARQLVAYRFTDDKPGFPHGRGVDDVGHADPAREAVEHAPAAGVRVAAHEERAGQGVGVVGDELVADALVVADVVEAPDAELLDESAGDAVRRGALPVGDRGAMVEHHDDALRMLEPPDLAPARRHEHRVDEHHGVHAHGDQIAGTDFRLSGLAGEDFFGEGHAHMMIRAIGCRL